MRYLQTTIRHRRRLRKTRQLTQNEQIRMHRVFQAFQKQGEPPRTRTHAFRNARHFSVFRLQKTVPHEKRRALPRKKAHRRKIVRMRGVQPRVSEQRLPAEPHGNASERAPVQMRNLRENVQIPAKPPATLARLAFGIARRVSVLFLREIAEQPAGARRTFKNPHRPAAIPVRTVRQKVCVRQRFKEPSCDAREQTAARVRYL